MQNLIPTLEKPHFSSYLYPLEFEADVAAPITMPFEYIAAGAAKALYYTPEGCKFALKLCKTRSKELNQYVQKSKYPHIFLSIDHLSIDAFNALYGLFLSSKPEDIRDCIKLLSRNFDFSEIFESLTPNINFKPKLQHHKKDAEISIYPALYIMHQENEPSYYVDSYESQLEMATHLLVELCPLMGLDLNEIHLGKSDFFLLTKKSLRCLRADYQNFPLPLLDFFSIILNFCYPDKKKVKYIIYEKPSAEYKDKLQKILNIFVDVIVPQSKSLSYPMIKQIITSEFDTFFSQELVSSFIAKKAVSFIVFASEEGNDDEEEVDEVSALEKQISILQKERAKQATEISSLLQQVSDLELQLRRNNGELNLLQEELKSYKDQLESVQALDEDDELTPVEQLPPITEEDLSILRRMRVVIFGGHSRMHQHFMLDNMPWEFVDAHGMVDKKVLESADMILVISKYISHAAFFFVRSAGEKNPDIGKKTFFCSYKNKELVYHQILDWLHNQNQMPDAG